jgi:bifunctional DNA-binding transcriptional regulator/antitoxin component of YhaV-PrlF toxin-antitoxin module
MQFSAILQKFDSPLWSYHIIVPDSVAKIFIDDGSKRVVCTLNREKTFQCALMPKGDGSWFININKELRDTLNLKEGSTIEAVLQKDESEYGLPMPEELAELLKLDEAGNRLFHALTPGKQRNLLYIAGSPKISDTRLRKSVIVIEHLKVNNGKINFKQLYEDLKGRDF